ncbi:MAG: NADH-quinone oxidoreductase subunit L, partial [Bacteroidota bacterium]
VHESPKLMTISLLVLASLSLFVFYSFDPFGASSGWFYSAVVRPISIVPDMLQPAGASLLYDAVHGVHGTAMILSIVIAAGGVLFALAAYQWKKVSPDKMARLMGALYRGSLNKWYFDEAYNKVFLAGALRISHGLRWFDANVIDAAVNGTAVVTRKLSTIHRWFDERVVDGLVNLTARGVGIAGNLFGQVQTGRVQTYLTYVIVSFLMLALLFMGL